VLETELLNRVAATTGAHALWTGQGGDHIFLQMSNSLSAGDYFAMRGFRPGFAAAVRDAARLSRQPYWSVLRSALERQGGRRKRPDGGSPSGLTPQSPASQTCFVDPAALPHHIDEYVAHPWAADTEDLPKGKAWQIRFLAQVTNRHRPIPRMERAPQHHPLMSQPLMEVCLQLPTYLLVRGGRERSLARDAFADRVPAEIIRRRDKGSIKSHATEAIRQSEAFVRELLLDGVLASEGLVVRSDLEPYIVHGQPFREDHFLPLLACIAAEVWVRACTRSAVAAAA
jgi:asparagine synthase (glutamine-hydrolysing)